jgi:hypothetical protein
MQPEVNNRIQDLWTLPKLSQFKPYFFKIHFSIFAKATRGFEPIVHVYMFLHTLLNVLVQIANKMGLQKKNQYFLQVCA